jgi:hypothetical protein
METKWPSVSPFLLLLNDFPFWQEISRSEFPDQEKIPLTQTGRPPESFPPNIRNFLHSPQPSRIQPCCLNPDGQTIFVKCFSLRRVSAASFSTTASSQPASTMSATNLAPLKLVVTNSSMREKASVRHSSKSSSGSDFHVSEAGSVLRARQRIGSWHPPHANLHMEEDPHDFYLGDIYARINRPFDCSLSTQAEREYVIFLVQCGSVPDIGDQLQRDDRSVS